MKRCMLISLCFLFSLNGFSQKLNGQWKGYFDSNGDIGLYSGDNTEYILELEVKGNKVTGSSYSYFQNRKYYVICSIAGTYNIKSKSVVITETARIKGNTPDNTDCLQIHSLTYKKLKNEEKLEGSWKPVPHQIGNCGVGKTLLVRRTLSKDLASYNKPTQNNPFSAPPVKKMTPVHDLTAKSKTVTPSLTKTNPKSKTIKPVSPVTPQTPVTTEIKKEAPVVPDKPTEPTQEIADNGFEKRNNELLKTIEIKNETFTVSLYDNGYVDGDSISLFYNGKLILPHRRLSEKPINITLDATTDREINELIMYADNLGEIPPNTALMIITDGTERYEVHISSDLKKSGSIHFIHKNKPK